MIATVVFGARTRLGRAVLDGIPRSAPVLLIARDPARHPSDSAELETLARGRSGTRVVGMAELSTLALPAGVDGLRVVIAALGPIHPTDADAASPFTEDAARVEAEIHALTRVLAAARAAGVAVSVVFVSTVLALAPGRRRRYYGGWKSLMEQLVEEAVERSSDGTLSVIHPGRIRTDESPLRPWQRVHASYARVAASVLAASSGPPQRRLVGVDARIWLVVRSISFALASLKPVSGRRRATSGGL